jgi:hypothetical protein
MKPPTVFAFRTGRLVGVEIELDASYSAPVHAVDVAGWSRKPDASVYRGWEYVLEPAIPFTQLRDSVRRFCATASDKKVYAGKKGSTHVHVQAHDITHWQMYALSHFYYEARDFICKLVPPSRVTGNIYCPIKAVGDFNSFYQSWNLGFFYANRAAACRPTHVGSFVTQGRYNAVNLSPVRVEDPMQRSIEFRQGAASTRFASSYGWSAFCVALVEMVKNLPEGQLLTVPTTWSSFVGIISNFDAALGQWVEWRADYLYRDANEDDVSAVSDVMGDGRDYGLFTVARRADMSLNVAKKVLDLLIQRGSVSKVGRTVVTNGTSAVVDKFVLQALDQTSTVDRYFSIVSQR